jgi:hypothetical protein
METTLECISVVHDTKNHQTEVDFLAPDWDEKFTPAAMLVISNRVKNPKFKKGKLYKICISEV